MTGQDTSHVCVRFFSVLREVCGVERIEVELPSTQASGEDLLDELEQHYPQLRSYRPTLRLAVNHTYEPPSVHLRDGDEVALITPVSGG